MEFLKVGYKYTGEHGSFTTQVEVWANPARWSQEVATWRENMLNPDQYEILYVQQGSKLLYRKEGVRLV